MRSLAKKITSLWLGCFLLAVVSGFSWADAPGEITGVKLDPAQQGIVIVAKGNLGKHQARVIGQPNRLVMDFADTALGNVPARIAGGSFSIHEIRVGEKDSRARVVADFQDRPVPPFTVKREGNQVMVVFGPALSGRPSGSGAPSTEGGAKLASPSSPPPTPWVIPAAATGRGGTAGTPTAPKRSKPQPMPAQPHTPGLQAPQAPVATAPHVPQAKFNDPAAQGGKPDTKQVRVAQRMDLDRPPTSPPGRPDDGPRRVAPAPGSRPPAADTPSSQGAPPSRMVREVRPPVTPPTPDPRLLVQEITELKFVQVGHNARLVIRGGDRLDYRVTNVSPTKLRIDLINAEIPKAHQNALDTEQFSTSVEMIVPGSQSIFVQLKDSVPYQVQKKKGILMVDFPPPRFNPVEKVAAGAERDTSALAARIIQEEQTRGLIENRNKAIQGLQKEQEQLQRQRAEVLKRYQATPDPEVFNKPVTLDFQGIALKNAFRLLAEQAGINIIYGGTEGATTLRLVDVPLGHVIDTLCYSYGLDRVMLGNVMRVGPSQVIQTWKEQQQKEYDAAIKAVDARLEKIRKDVTGHQQEIERLLSDLKKLQETPVEKPTTEDIGEAGCITVEGEKVCFIYSTVRLTYADPKQIIPSLNCIFRLQCAGQFGFKVSELSQEQLKATALGAQLSEQQRLAEQGFQPGAPGSDARAQRFERQQADVQRADAQTSLARTAAQAAGAKGTTDTGLTTQDKTIQQIISYGMLWGDDQNRMIFIKDTPERVAQMKKLIYSLDVPVPQVTIESRIVQANRTWARGLGIRWGGRNNQNGPVTRDSGSPNFGTSAPADATDMRLNKWGYWGITGLQGLQGANTATGQNTDGNDIPSQMAVALPALLTPVVSGFGMQFGLLAGEFITELDLRIELGESTNQAKVISRPKVQVQNRKKALIKTGQKIAFSTISSEGTQTQFIDVDLKLEVEPEIYSDGRIKMEMNVTDNNVSSVGVNGQAAIDTREARTTMIVKDGETAVIGGVIKKTDTNQKGGLPGLMNLPILSYLFSNKGRLKQVQELLVFITPVVVRRPPPAS